MNYPSFDFPTDVSHETCLLYYFFFHLPNSITALFCHSTKIPKKTEEEEEKEGKPQGIKTEKNALIQKKKFFFKRLQYMSCLLETRSHCMGGGQGVQATGNRERRPKQYVVEKKIKGSLLCRRTFVNGSTHQSLCLTFTLPCKLFLHYQVFGLFF